MDPLTQYLNNHACYQNTLVEKDENLAHKIWSVCFETKWAGPLTLLPKALPNIHKGLQLVTTREMYHRLLEVFPDNLYTHPGVPLGKDRSYDHGLIHIPMRHQWLDLINFNDFPMDPYKYAEHGVHLELHQALPQLYRPPERNVVSSTMNRFISSAVVCGYINLVFELFNSIPKYCEASDFDDIADEAASHGHIKLLELLLDHDFECHEHAIEDAASKGHLDVVQSMARRRRDMVTPNAILIATKQGGLEIFKSLMAALAATREWHENYWFEYEAGAIFDTIAGGGLLDIIHYLHFEVPTETSTTNAMDWAAKNNHFEVVEVLHAQRTEGCTYKALDYASENGHLEMVKWLHIHRSEGCSPNALIQAAANGHLRVVQYLHREMNLNASNAALVSAAAAGHLEVVQYLHQEMGCSCTEEALLGAIGASRLEVVQFLTSHLCEEVSSNVLFRANNKEVFEFLKKLYPHLYLQCLPLLRNAVEQRNLNLVLQMWGLFYQSDGPFCCRSWVTLMHMEGPDKFWDNLDLSLSSFGAEI
jgi:ankyrin repeat protein